MQSRQRRKDTDKNKAFNTATTTKYFKLSTDYDNILIAKTKTKTLNKTKPYNVCWLKYQDGHRKYKRDVDDFTNLTKQMFVQSIMNIISRLLSYPKQRERLINTKANTYTYTNNDNDNNQQKP